MIAAEMRKMRTIAQRSAAMIVSMSPPCVDRSSAPLHDCWRRIGTATEMIVSPLALTRTTDCTVPARACVTSARLRPLEAANSSRRGSSVRPKLPRTAFQVRSIKVIASSAGGVPGDRSG